MGKKDTRLNMLIRMLRENGSMMVNDLSSLLNVSTMTVRRDLDELQNNGLVTRAHGRAELSQPVPGAQYENIENVYTLHGESEKMFEEKKRIGKRAASMVERGEVILIDNGSTTNHVIDFLPDTDELTVACYNLNIVQKLWRMERVHILMAGGFFHRGDMMFESAEGLRFLQGIRANKVFLSASGVHEKLGLTCAHNYEVLGKQTIIQSALKKILLVDSSKFGSIKTVFFAQLREIDIIVTDSGISDDWKDIISSKGIDLKIV
jgi:DeoR family deoxyribose operon repressor